MTPYSRQIVAHDSVFNTVHRWIDAAVVLAVLQFALQATPSAGRNDLLAIGAVAVLLLHTVAELSGVYRSWRGTRLAGELRCILLTWTYTALILLGIGMVTTYNAHFSYTTKLLFVFCSPVALAGVRIVLRKLQQSLRARGFNVKRVAVCGVNPLGFQLARNVEQSPELGLRLAGFFDDRPRDRTPELPSDVGQRVGTVADLVRQARDGKVDIVYITFPMRAEQRIQRILAELGDTTASVYIVPDFFVFELLHARWTSINGLPAVSVFESPLYGVDGLAKRMADLIFGTLLLAVASIPMMAIALAIKLTSRGPVFFRQKRYGLDGRVIHVWKFRSMAVCEDDGAVRQATRDDCRVTPLGRILRKTSLDELPQLFNVIGGSMSLVGPRPHATAHNEQYRSLIGGYMLRHKVKPGITGLAQVNGWRGETETLDKMANRVACDHQYIREWSFAMDLRILLKTLVVVFAQKNAY